MFAAVGIETIHHNCFVALYQVSLVCLQQSFKLGTTYCFRTSANLFYILHNDYVRTVASFRDKQATMWRGHPYSWTRKSWQKNPHLLKVYFYSAFPFISNVYIRSSHFLRSYFPLHDPVFSHMYSVCFCLFLLDPFRNIPSLLRHECWEKGNVSGPWSWVNTFA